MVNDEIILRKVAKLKEYVGNVQKLWHHDIWTSSIWILK